MTLASISTSAKRSENLAKSSWLQPKEGLTRLSSRVGGASGFVWFTAVQLSVDTSHTPWMYCSLLLDWRQTCLEEAVLRFPAAVFVSCRMFQQDSDERSHDSSNDDLPQDPPGLSYHLFRAIKKNLLICSTAECNIGAFLFQKWTQSRNLSQRFTFVDTSKVNVEDVVNVQRPTRVSVSAYLRILLL